MSSSADIPLLSVCSEAFIKRVVLFQSFEGGVTFCSGLIKVEAVGADTILEYERGVDSLFSNFLGKDKSR